MTTSGRYILARTAGKRPTLQHELKSYTRTICGRDITGWSRAYTDQKFGPIFCKTCEKGGR